MTDYDKNATDFLERFQIRMKIKRSGNSTDEERESLAEIR